MSISINSVLGNYTYNYGQKLQPRIDKDNDARWSKTELQNYANAYGKATGNKLDVDSLLEKYGQNGYIDTKGQGAVKKDDALGLSKLENAAQTAFQQMQRPAAKAPSLEELLADMSGSRKAYFSSAISKYNSQQSLLNNFSSMNGSYGFESVLSARSAANMYRLQMNYSGGDAYTAMSGQLMNFTA